uniref:hypothetical protein n=1 Tax=Streptomyces sp. IBSBF 2806 TaxID=2903529 RepID=UPI002FDBC839
VRTCAHRPPGIVVSGPSARLRTGAFPDVTDPLTPPPRDGHIELRNLKHVAQTATEPAEPV